ncbi:MAG: DUF4190 domain-containing protein [Deltaproteobacteria bacterium]|nr:DUF4190 domain-containing protein [Deltaproteobacteria bacterium]
MQTQAASVRAIAAMILGVLSFLCFGFITGIPAIILAVFELKAIKRGEAPAKGDSIAKTGLTMGIIGTSLSLLMLILGMALLWLGISLTTGDALQDLLMRI